jgi:hypothetical protein
LRGSPLSVAPRRFAALFHAARARWSRPSELSLPGEPFPLSRAVASLRVRVRSPPTRRERDTFAFSFVPTLCPERASSPGTGGPGPKSPRDRWPEPGTEVPRTVRLTHAGLAVDDRHARFEAFLPPGVRSHPLPCPGQGESARPVLSWALQPPQSLPQHDPGFRYCARARDGRASPVSTRPRKPARLAHRRRSAKRGPPTGRV